MSEQAPEPRIGWRKSLITTTVEVWDYWWPDGCRSDNDSAERHEQMHRMLDSAAKARYPGEVDRAG